MKTNKTTLYIGLNDKDSRVQLIDTVEAVKIVTSLLRGVNIDGATVYNATGIYTHNDGSIVIENTLRVELFEASEADVLKGVELIKVALNQESIIVSNEIVESKFI